MKVPKQNIRAISKRMQAKQKYQDVSKKYDSNYGYF